MVSLRTLGNGIIVAGCMAALASQAAAQESVSFKDKQIKLLIGSATGGGTDATGRLVARYIGKFLPGNPTVYIQNMPGAGGITALAFFANRTEPDGLTFTVSSQTTLDPLIFRRGNINYDPKSIPFIGSANRGSTLFFVHPSAKDRLYDKKAEPVPIGNIGPIPRSAMMPGLWGIEYLGWNAKWVSGYPGTAEVMLAYDRGEVGATATGDLNLLEDRMKKNQIFVLNQSGTFKAGKVVGSPEFGDAPIFYNQMREVQMPEVSKRALDYWIALSDLDKWFGLPPRTPADIVAAYRTAYDKMVVDKEFIAAAKGMGDSFASKNWKDTELLAAKLTDTPPEALEFLKDLMRKQGFKPG
jgi:hypothetical protein